MVTLLAGTTAIASGGRVWTTGAPLEPLSSVLTQATAVPARARMMRLRDLANICPPGAGVWIHSRRASLEGRARTALQLLLQLQGSTGFTRIYGDTATTTDFFVCSAGHVEPFPPVSARTLVPL